MSEYTKKVESLLAERLKIIEADDKKEEEMNEGVDILDWKNLPRNPEVEEYTKQIKDYIIEKYNEMPIEFVIETCTRLGEAPNLLYDDNGNFAVSGIGMQPVVTGDERIEDENLCSYVESASWWFPTIREAVYNYLTRE